MKGLPPSYCFINETNICVGLPFAWFYNLLICIAKLKYDTKLKYDMIVSSPVGSLCHTPGVVCRPSSVVRRESSVVCRLCSPYLPEIIKLSNPYLVQMFTMFLDCAS